MYIVQSCRYRVNLLKVCSLRSTCLLCNLFTGVYANRRFVWRVVEQLDGHLKIGKIKKVVTLRTISTLSFELNSAYSMDL